MEFTPDSAKQFLLSKIEEQASQDGIALDEIERRMFLFSELAGRPDLEANEKFDKEYGSNEYELKVAKLLARSYARDKKTEDGKALWSAALKALSREDFYGLVMVDQAKIPRTNEALWIFLLGMLPFAALEIGLVAIGAIVVFQPSMFGLHLPDWFRLLLLPVFFWMFWYVGKISARRQSEKSARRNESQLL